VKDLASYRNCAGWTASTSVPVALAAALLWSGNWLEANRPELGTDGDNCWSGASSCPRWRCTTPTYTINSLCHVFGQQRYTTGDDSRNNFWLALVTLARLAQQPPSLPSSVRQGFYWWEVDVTWYGLKLLSWLASSGT